MVCFVSFAFKSLLGSFRKLLCVEDAVYRQDIRIFNVSRSGDTGLGTTSRDIYVFLLKLGFRELNCAECGIETLHSQNFDWMRLGLTCTLNVETSSDMFSLWAF